MDGYYAYTPNQEGQAALLEWYAFQDSLDINSAPQNNRRRSLSDSYLGIYAAFCVTAEKERRRRSSLLPVTPLRLEPPIPPQLSAEQIATTIQYGLLNLIRPTFESAPQRTTELVYTIRLNMINLYLKYIVQALLYLLAAVLLFTIVTWCAKFLSIAIVPLTLIYALHIAAREMHQSDNRLHATNAHQDRSLIERQDWATQIHGLIDRTANYSVGFFSGLTSYLANSSLLDKQIAHIPDNSPRDLNLR